MKKNEPLVTVILPTHNAEKTIDRCLTSVVNQTYKNLEIICCDDCSTDSTWEKLTEWSEKDSRIKILRNSQNMRAAFSRNRCIEQAKGEYIAQIDDDDYCAENRIQVQVDFLNNNAGYDFLGTGIYYFDESGIWGQSERKEGYAPVAKDFLKSSVFSNPTMMYRTETMRAVGGYRVAKETRRSQDYDMHMRMYIAGFKGYIIPDLLTYYYRGENSFPKCKYRYRIDEAKIRFKNFKKLGLFPQGILYALKPLIVGLIPIKWIEKHKKRVKSKKIEK